MKDNKFLAPVESVEWSDPRQTDAFDAKSIEMK